MYHTFDQRDWCIVIFPGRFWATWMQKMYVAISPETYFQYSQTQPQFLQNYEIIQIKS